MLNPIRGTREIRGCLMVSVVIPTLGRDQVLMDTLASLAALKEKADEVIVVDQTRLHEPETDAYLNSEHGSGRICLIRHQPPGVVGAMNRGLHEAKGDIVLFLDDDIIPSEGLVAAHRHAHEQYLNAWAVVGQVVQGENTETLKTETLKRETERGGGENAETLKTETLKREKERGGGENAETLKREREGEIAETLKAEMLKGKGNVGIPSHKRNRMLISAFQYFSISAFSPKRISALRRDLDFAFDGTEPTWVENVMAGNLSVKRQKATVIGGFDENFIPPVSFRFETEFAKRMVAAGGRIWFEPKASILHLRAQSGGTRSQGSHLTSSSPVHGVGDYYYALKHGKGWDRLCYMLRRPFREVCSKFHLQHPWWIPVKLIGELRAIWLAVGLHRAVSTPLSNECAAKAFYEAQYSDSLYAAYAEPTMHPFFAEINRLLDQYGRRNGKWLEVGCGRGFLQDVVDDYTGVDVAATVAAFMHKPFCCARAEALPFGDDVYDGLWSYAVLEHVENPEQALLEMRRVLKPGGILFLAPAWQCRPWAATDCAWKPWRNLSRLGRLRKALIPVRESVVVRAFFVFPRRLFHLLRYHLIKTPIRFCSQPLTPNYSEYKVVDADARHHMDPFDAILWFRSRGDQVLSQLGWRRQFFVRTGTLVIEMDGNFREDSERLKG